MSRLPLAGASCRTPAKHTGAVQQGASRTSSPGGSTVARSERKNTDVPASATNRAPDPADYHTRRKIWLGTGLLTFRRPFPAKVKCNEMEAVAV